MRGLISAVVVAVAIVLQLAVADRIPFPGGAGPNLVLLTVAALALATGSMAGSVTGFFAGLALDVAPPAGHLVGEDALVFCLIGYSCGLLAVRPSADGRQDQEHSALFEIAVTAAGAACGEAMAAGLGVMLSDPRVTWAAIKHVLPAAIAYDLLLSPFVLFAVAALLGMADAMIPRGTPSGAAQARARQASWTPAPQASALRQAGSGGTPRLRLSGTGGRSEGWLTGGGAGGTSGGTRAGPGRSGAREPRLKLGRGGSLAGGSAFAGTGPKGGGLPGTSKVKFAARRGEGVVGGSRLGAPKLATSRLGASLLGGSVFSRPAPRLGRSLAGRPRPQPGRSPLLPGRSAFRTGRGALSGALRTKPGHTRLGSLGSGSHQPRFRRQNVMSRLVRGLRRPDRAKSPGRGWLRGPATSGRGSLKTGLRSPGSGWLGRPRRHRALARGTGGRALGRSPARLRIRPAKLKRRPGGLR
ncbi:MAG TPA: rod shape-determining protein MreD [Streptosporangiaceae bacterium]|nr:rod shape-determining protein MreD [Streptosporangiaceae bacterium]